jgi:hypothetical protein
MDSFVAHGLLSFSGSRYYKARSVQGIFVRNDNHGPCLPHLRQVCIHPEIAPINLPDFWRSNDSRLYPWWLTALLFVVGQSVPQLAGRKTAIQTLLIELVLKIN